MYNLVKGIGKIQLFCMYSVIWIL